MPHRFKTMGEQMGRRSWAEPWKIKMVEKKLTAQERIDLIVSVMVKDDIFYVFNSFEF